MFTFSLHHATCITEFLRHFSNPSLSSPYVSSIRALDRVILPASKESSQDPFLHTSSNPVSLSLTFFL